MFISMFPPETVVNAKCSSCNYKTDNKCGCNTGRILLECVFNALLAVTSGWVIVNVPEHPEQTRSADAVAGEVVLQVL